MAGINDSKCVLVVGATAGIGRALALAIHALPSKPTVIVTGRRKERLDELVKKGQESGEGRIEAVQVDISAGSETLRGFSEEVVRKFPEVDTVIFSAGIQRTTDFKKPEGIDLDALFDEVNTNYLAFSSLINFFMPHFLKLSVSNFRQSNEISQSEGRPTFLIPISSGLAILSKFEVADHWATMAALHSLSISLRKNVSDTNVHVMEILPPLVESELHDQRGTTEQLSKLWMPLDEFTKHTMDGLQRGDLNIVVPSMKGLWEKLEANRIAMRKTRSKRSNAIETRVTRRVCTWVK